MGGLKTLFSSSNFSIKINFEIPRRISDCHFWGISSSLTSKKLLRIEAPFATNFFFWIFGRVNRCRTEKKSSPQDCVSPRGHFASRMFLLRFSFFEINSSARIRMALKRHTVLHRLSFQKNCEPQQKSPRALIVQKDDLLAQIDGFSIKNFSKNLK